MLWVTRVGTLRVFIQSKEKKELPQLLSIILKWRFFEVNHVLDEDENVNMEGDVDKDVDKEVEESMVGAVMNMRVNPLSTAHAGTH